MAGKRAIKKTGPLTRGQQRIVSKIVFLERPDPVIERALHKPLNQIPPGQLKRILNALSTKLVEPMPKAPMLKARRNKLERIRATLLQEWDRRKKPL